MASSLISGAVVLLLILIGGYVIAGGILNMSETIVYTQAEMTAIQQKNLNTEINILYTNKTADWFLIGVSNNGSTNFGGTDLDKTEVFIGYADKSVTRSSLTGHYEIINDRMNKNIWDESEILNISYSGLISSPPTWVKLVTSNGVTAATNL